MNIYNIKINALSLAILVPKLMEDNSATKILVKEIDNMMEKHVLAQITQKKYFKANAKQVSTFIYLFKPVFNNSFFF